MPINLLLKEERLCEGDLLVCWHKCLSKQFCEGMVHLIYKFYLKAVFVCVKFNGAIGFSEKRLFLT